MERVESKELKKYLLDYVESTLESCKLFTKTYGKGFVRKRLNKTLDKVYIETYNDINAGRYNYLDHSITISSPLRNIDDLMTMSALKKNDRIDIKTTMLHEAIHAILARMPEECMDGKQIMGTGLFELYQNDTELGRGLNEGLTNWICQKVGLAPKSYRNLTKMVELLEMAVGEERVMQLGKGDIKGNVAEQLNMNQEEVIEFLAKIDRIYYTERKILGITNIVEMLEKIQQLAESNINLFLKEKQKIQDTINELRENALFTKIINSQEFKQFQEEQNKGQSFEKVILFFVHKLEKQRKKSNYQICLVHEDIFNKYLKKETETMMQSGIILLKLRKKFERIWKLLEINRYEKINDGKGNYNSYRFARRYRRLKTRGNLPLIPKRNAIQAEFRHQIADVGERKEQEKTGKKQLKEEWERE